MAREAQVGRPACPAASPSRTAAPSTCSPLAGLRPARPKVDFGAPDGPADLVFLIAAPAGGGADHLTLLTALARALVKPEFVASLRAAATPRGDRRRSSASVVQPPRRPSRRAPACRCRRQTPRRTAPRGASRPDAERQRSVVAVTACPTGIAHTYMAADSLVAAGEASRRRRCTSRPQGSSGATPLDAEQSSRAADAVIFADRRRRQGPGPLRRQAGRRVGRQAGDQRAGRDDPRGLAAADDPNARRVAAATAAAAAGGAGAGAGGGPSLGAASSGSGCSPVSAT